MTFLTRRSWSSSAKTLNVSLPTFTRKQYGIKIWVEPESPTVDIVFVHGLKGDRDLTWTSKELGSPWPQVLLPSRTPSARILSYGYDSNPADLRSVVSNNRIDNHARNLLSSLSTCRQSDENRPLILVAHSMGGLVVQDMLVASKSSPEKHLQMIQACTSGIIFMGTPHSGSALAHSAERLAKVLGIVNTTNPRIIRVLRKDSEVLARIQNEFHSLIRKRLQENLNPIEITCFYEELPMPGIGEVVPQASAILQGYTSIGIHSHHRDMVRFSSFEDPGFISVVGELERWTTNMEGRNNSLPPETSTLWNIGSSTREESSIYGEIKIGGNVIKSNIINGSQVVYGGLTFQD